MFCYSIDQCVICSILVILRKVSQQLVVVYTSRLGEAVHALVDIDVNLAIIYEWVGIVMVYNLFWYDFYGKPYVPIP